MTDLDPGRPPLRDPIGVDTVPPPPASAAGRLRSGMRGAALALRARGRLHVDGSAHFGRNVAIVIEPGARVVLGDGCSLGDGTRIEARGGEVRIAAGTRVGRGVVIRSRVGVTVGADCVIGDYASIADAEPTIDEVERPIRKQPVRAAPIAIGDRARVSAHAAVLAGASIGADAAVGSYAVVTGDVPERTAVAGVPAQPLGPRADQTVARRRPA
jgi:acetyltransferase-like isoleucine patch superfamily enzyme